MTPLTFREFAKQLSLSKESMSAEIFENHRDRIKVKKPETAIPNLVKIIDATLVLMNRKGFQAMSLRDLSHEAGLSMGAMYDHFGSKDDLLAMLQLQGSLFIERFLSRPPVDAGTPVEKLHWFLRAQVYLSEILKPWFYFSFMEAKHFDTEGKRRAKETDLLAEQITQQLLVEGQESGLLAKDLDARLIASLIQAMLQDWYLKPWKYKDRKISVDDYAAHIIDFVNRATRP